MTQSLKIALASPVLRLGDLAYNLAKMEQLLASSTPDLSDVDLWVFPEISIAGGFLPGGLTAHAITYQAWAQPVPDGPACRYLLGIARQYHTHICAGLLERDGESVSITHVLCGPDGVIGCQRKLFPQNPTMTPVFTAGDALLPFALKGRRGAIMACADWMFPETTILAGIADVEFILAPTDWFAEADGLKMQKLLCAKAMGVGVPIIAVFGHDHGAADSPILAGMALDAQGEVLVSVIRASDRDQVAVIDVLISPPSRKWGGSAARVDLLARSLQTYQQSKQTRKEKAD